MLPLWINECYVRCCLCGSTSVMSDGGQFSTQNQLQQPNLSGPRAAVRQAVNGSGLIQGLGVSVLRCSLASLARLLVGCIRPPNMREAKDQVRQARLGPRLELLLRAWDGTKGEAPRHDTSRGGLLSLRSARQLNTTPHNSIQLKPTQTQTNSNSNQLKLKPTQTQTSSNMLTLRRCPMKLDPERGDVKSLQMVCAMTVFRCWECRFGWESEGETPEMQVTRFYIWDFKLTGQSFF